MAEAVAAVLVLRAASMCKLDWGNDLGCHAWWREHRGKGAQSTSEGSIGMRRSCRCQGTAWHSMAQHCPCLNSMRLESYVVLEMCFEASASLALTAQTQRFAVLALQFVLLD